MIEVHRRSFVQGALAAATLFGGLTRAAVPKSARCTNHVHNEQPFATAALAEDGYRPPAGVAGLRHTDAEGEIALRFLAYNI